jgi:hypothetical protein
MASCLYPPPDITSVFEMIADMTIDRSEIAYVTTDLTIIQKKIRWVM